MIDLPSTLFSARSIAENKKIVPPTSGFDFSFSLKLPSPDARKAGPLTLTLLQIGKTKNLQNRITGNHLGKSFRSSVLRLKLREELYRTRTYSRDCRDYQDEVTVWVLDNMYFGWIEAKISSEMRNSLRDHFKPILNKR